MQVLRSEKIEFAVAPYEADAQLAYMSSLEEEKGGIGAVITEDSDLMAYGCPSVRTSPKHWDYFMSDNGVRITICNDFEQIIFKMDRYGNGERIELEKVFNAETCKPSFRSFNMELFTGNISLM